jgi:hypothetical protein
MTPAVFVLTNPIFEDGDTQMRQGIRTQEDDSKD